MGCGERWGYSCRDAAFPKRRLPSGSTSLRSALRPAVGPTGPGRDARCTQGWAVRVDFVRLQQDGLVHASRCPRVQPAGWLLCLPLAGSGADRAPPGGGDCVRVPGCRPPAGLRLSWRRSGGPAGKEAQGWRSALGASQ